MTPPGRNESCHDPQGLCAELMCESTGFFRGLLAGGAHQWREGSKPERKTGNVDGHKRSQEKTRVTEGMATQREGHAGQHRAGQRDPSCATQRQEHAQQERETDETNDHACAQRALGDQLQHHRVHGSVDGSAHQETCPKGDAKRAQESRSHGCENHGPAKRRSPLAREFAKTEGHEDAARRDQGRGIGQCLHENGKPEGRIGKG